MNCTTTTGRVNGIPYRGCNNFGEIVVLRSVVSLKQDELNLLCFVDVTSIFGLKGYSNAYDLFRLFGYPIKFFCFWRDYLDDCLNYCVENEQTVIVCSA